MRYNGLNTAVYISMNLHYKIDSKMIELIDFTPTTKIPKYRPIVIPKKYTYDTGNIIYIVMKDYIEMRMAISYEAALKKNSTLNPIEVVDQLYNQLDDLVKQLQNADSRAVAEMLIKVAEKNYPK